MSNKLRLSLDSMFQDDYYYTDYDIGSSGHEIIIDVKDRNEFLDAFAAEWRKRADMYLEDVEEDE
jgi:hypothetical protein